MDDAELTPRRAWQLELNLEWDKLRLSARPALWQTIFDAELAYGLGPRLEGSVAVPLIVLASETGTSDPKERQDVGGIGDASFAVKYRFTGRADARHALAGGISVELPTGSREKGLGSSLVDVAVTLATERRLTDVLTLRFNGGGVFAGNTQKGALGIRERGAIFNAGTSLVASLGPAVLLGAELAGAWSAEEDLDASTIGWQVGGNVLMTRRLSLDCGVIGGRSDASPAIAVQIGCTIALTAR